MTTRPAILALFLALASLAPAHAALAVRHPARAFAAGADAVAPPTTAETPAPLVADSLRRMPASHIPVGTFGPFGVPAPASPDGALDQDIAPQAPLAPSPSGLLQFRGAPEPFDE